MPLKIVKDTITPMLKREAEAHINPASIGYRIVTRLLSDAAFHLQYKWTRHILDDPPYPASGATGDYQRSITIDPTMYWEGTRHKRRVYTATPYAIYIERGTGPAIGNPPFHLPKSAIPGLQQWISRKGLDMNVYQLMKSIGQHGTAPRPHHRRAEADVQADWKALETQAMDAVMREGSK